MLDFDKFREYVKGFVDGYPSDPDGDWPPLVLLDTDTGLVVALLYGLSPEEFPVAVRALVKEKKASAVALATSVWTLDKNFKTAEEAEREKAKYGRIENHPDKAESLILSISDRSRTETLHAVIIRSKDKPPTLGAWKTATRADGPIASITAQAFPVFGNA